MLVCTLRQLPDGGIAQLVERLVRNQQVRGSNPLASTEFRVLELLKVETDTGFLNG